jgi:amino acid permease
MTTFEWKGTHEGQLRRALRVRHLVMLSVGGRIAAETAQTAQVVPTEPLRE